MGEDGAYRWEPGDQIVRRELCLGRPWLGQAAIVVEDSGELLALYVAEGSELAYPDGDWPGGRHPWQGKERWRGHGVLQLRRPDEAYACDRVAAELEAGRRWWSDAWADWRPDAAWRGGDLPEGWKDA